MKKLLAVLLALMMVLVSAAALAENLNNESVPESETQELENENQGTEENNSLGNGDATPAAAPPTQETRPSAENGQDATKADQTVTVTKLFSVSGTGAKNPAQTVSFTVETGTVANSSAASAPAVSIDSVNFEEGETEKYITIHLPVFTSVGIYTYPVVETDTNVAGVSYASDLELKITVIQAADGLQIAGIALRQNDVKTDTLMNEYKANALTVGKTVSGNMGDQNKAFPITVTLTAPANDKVYGSIGVTISGEDATVKDGSTDITNVIAAEAEGWTTKTLNLSLKHGQTVRFDNIPEGTTYTVVEDSVIEHIDGLATAAQQDNPNAYEVSGEITTARALTSDVDATITNTKNVEIDTGVALDSSAYVLIMALSLAGFVMLKVRRREEY